MFTRKPGTQGNASHGVPASDTDQTAPQPQFQMQGDTTAQPATNQTARTATMAPTHIGADFKITGHAVSDGEVRVDGEIEGDIECGSLTVGETAKITGNVLAEDVTIQGKVMGSVRGSRVTLQATSHMEGDVYHQQLAIEQGAFFEGKSRRSDNPVAEGRRPGEAAGNMGVSAAPQGNGITTDGTTTLNGKSGSGASGESLIYGNS